MDDAETKLRSVPALATLSDAALTRLAGQVKWTRAARNEAIVVHLERADSVFFIIEGAAHVKLPDAAGRAVALRRLDAGRHFGEIAALTGAPRTVEVIAASDCVLAECPRTAFEDIMSTEARFAHEVAISLARTVVSLTERVFELAALEVRYRLYAELLRMAKSGHSGAEGVVIEPMPTHEAIAATIGSQREPVTRELGFLTGEGIIRQTGRTLHVLDVERLQALVQHRAGVTLSQLLDWQT